MFTERNRCIHFYNLFQHDTTQSETCLQIICFNLICLWVVANHKALEQATQGEG